MLTVDLMRELELNRIDYDLIRHQRTLTALDEARVVGVAPEEVAKTIVLVDGGFVRATLPACARLDVRKVNAALGEEHHLRLATEAELAAAYPMFELGAVPPCGGPAGDRVLVDRRVAEAEFAVIEAGRHDLSVRLKTDDLLALTAAEVYDLTE